MRWIILASVVLLTAAAAPRDSKTVHFAICTSAGVEPGCVVARGDDGALYNVGKMPAGRWLQGTATVTNRLTTCMQGKTIANFTPDPKQTPQPCAADRQ